MNLFSRSRGQDHGLTPADFPGPDLDVADGGAPQRAILGGGCFWCVEAVFTALDGVLEVTSGYAGDSAAKADYETVCTGGTNHAEVVEVRFDPGRISFGQLLKVFFSVAHDPTQLDRQGNDRGRQYRSVIFCVDDEQKTVAEAYIRKLDAAHYFADPIVTAVEPLPAFYAAEAYHQNYAALHPDQPYIQAVALPKVDKLETYYADRLKPPSDR
ncbi:MAG: peptide-methionine (S)-S-oxide reductase MsrA [Nevskiales bacterium]|nr:peptide-methionine (S)-S-oxide reductase MsrA [Nevskiales bacterium]